MKAVDMTGATAEDVAEQDVLDELERVTPTSPPDVEPVTAPPGGEHDTPVWDELADRWAALQPLLARTVDEEAP